MSSVNLDGFNIIPPPGDIPHEKPSVIWLKTPPLQAPSEILKETNPNLTIKSFRGAIENAFESLKELESLIAQDRKSPSEAGLKLVEGRLRQAQGYLEVISAAVQSNSNLRKTYGSTVDMMLYRLHRGEEAIMVRTDAYRNAYINDLLIKAREILPEIIPESIPEEYIDLREFAENLHEAIVSYAGEHVRGDSPLLPFSFHGKNLGVLKRFEAELIDLSGRVFDRLLSQAKPETRQLLNEFGKIAGYMTLDHKWAIYFLADSNPTFSYYDLDTKTDKRKDVITLFREIVEQAKSEKESNGNEIARDEYSPLSTKLGKLINTLCGDLLNILGDKEATKINKEISGFVNCLMSRVGSIFNSQPVTDTLSTAFGVYAPGTGFRYLKRLDNSSSVAHAYPPREAMLLRDSYLEWNEYGYWVKNEYFPKENGRLITWKGTFDFNNDLGATCVAETTVQLDLRPFDWLRDEDLQSVLGFVETVSSRQEGVDETKYAVTIKHPERIPSALRMAIMPDKAFWKRIDSKELSENDLTTAALAVERFLKIETTLKEFTLSLNKKLRKMFYESSENTAALRGHRALPIHHYSRGQRIGYAVKWRFANLGRTLSNAFRTKSRRKIHSTKISHALGEFDPIKILNRNKLSTLLQGASEPVRQVYLSTSSTLDSTEEKERYLELLVEMEKTISNTETNDVPVFAVLLRQKHLEESKKRILEKIDALENENFGSIKGILDNYLESLVTEEQAKIEATAGEIPNQVDHLFHLPPPNPSYSESLKRALAVKSMYDKELAKTLERVALNSERLTLEDDKNIRNTSFLPNIMLEPLEAACQVPELRPILFDYLTKQTFLDSLDVLSSRPKEQRLAVQRQFIEACIEKLTQIDSNNKNVEIINKLNNIVTNLNN